MENAELIELVQTLTGHVLAHRQVLRSLFLNVPEVRYRFVLNEAAIETEALYSSLPETTLTALREELARVTAYAPPQ